MPSVCWNGFRKPATTPASTTSSHAVGLDRDDLDLDLLAIGRDVAGLVADLAPEDRLAERAAFAPDVQVVGVVVVDDLAAAEQEHFLVALDLGGHDGTG